MTPPVIAPVRSSEPVWRTLAWAAVLALVVMGTSYAALGAPRDFGRAAPIWPANAFAVACILRSRPDRWWIWALAAAAGNLGADLVAGDDMAKALALTGCNILEIVICGLGLQRLRPRGFDPSRMADLAWGSALAAVGSFASAFLASSYLGLAHDSH